MFQTFSRRFTPNSPTNIAYFSSENQDPIKTNSSHLTSASQTSSEPFDSAIYLEQIPNRLHFNDSSGSALTPPTVMTALNGESSDCCNGKTYSPVVTPYATASIIQSQNHDTMLQSPKQQVQPNNNISLNDTINPMEFCPQNMYITCMDLSNCQKAMMITNTGGMECS
ncbi:unnamed protein product [Heterobilharzia americana]|nr:unnamed protein product [Heterobilharzia americana]